MRARSSPYTSSCYAMATSEVLKDPRDPGPLDDYEVNGMPLVFGGQVQVGYAARSPLPETAPRADRSVI